MGSNKQFDRNFHVFAVDDNLPDIELLKYLFLECNAPVQLHFAHDGVEASDFLFRRGAFGKNNIVPDLILLDLNLPKKDGRALLRELKGDKDLCKVPVIVISTSSSAPEVSDVYCLGASAFISKPTDIMKFQETIRRLVDFWFGSVILATRPVGGI